MGASPMEDKAGRREGAVLEPVAAVGDPPAHDRDWNGRDQRPPKRKRDVCDDPQRHEDGPEYFALHTMILFCPDPNG